jgi:SpoVK/Ycf46/Vps4 family AAA+-type ATPase
MNVLSINRLNNEYRASINKAEALHEFNNGEYSNEEGLCYQNAANIAGRLATMTIGTESEHWINAQQFCQQQMRVIWNTLHPSKAVKDNSSDDSGNDEIMTKNVTPDQENNEKTNPDINAKKGGQPGAEKKKYADGLKQEMVDSWFKKDPGYGFDEVVGMEDVKNLLSNCVRDDKMRALTEYLGLPTVQSFFFYGPPGCGKTFIIEAFVHELMKQGYKYMSLASADIHSKFSGEADKILKRVFAEAVDNAPCIIFMDEIDGVCQSRDLPNLSDFNMQLTTTFLTCFNELVKAERDKKSVIFIAATNYPSNVDTAMLDRVELIPIPMPDEEVRENTFRRKLEKLISLDEDVTWGDIVEATEGYSQRDINRVSQKLLMNIYKKVSECVKDSDSAAQNAVGMIKNGDFRLNKEMVDEVFGSYKPKPNADIERSLNEFEAKT